MIQLRLLPDPKNTERHEAHRVHDDLWGKGGQRTPKLVFAVNRLPSRQPEIESEQSHGHGKNTIAQSGQAFDTLARDPIVGASHGARVYQAGRFIERRG